MKSSLLLALSIAVLLPACASAPLDKIPELDCAQIETMQVNKLKPRSLTIQVTDQKQVNLTAGNAEAVASKIQSVLQCSAEKGGIKGGESKNHLIVTVKDCQPEEGQVDVAQTACVMINASLKTAKSVLTIDAHAANSYVRSNNNHHFTGEIDESYLKALQLLVHTLNEKLK
jgi:hypothetical protein